MKSISRKVKLKNEPSNNLIQGLDVVIAGSPSPSGLSITARNRTIWAVRVGIGRRSEPSHWSGSRRIEKADVGGDCNKPAAAEGRETGLQAAARDEVRGELIVCLVASSHEPSRQYVVGVYGL